MSGLIEFLQSLIGVFNFPGLIADNVVSFFEKNGVSIPIGAKPWFALLISLFVCFVPYLYDKLTSRMARAFFAYGALYSALSALILVVAYFGPDPGKYNVRGSVTAFSNEGSNKEFSQTFNTTVGCADKAQPIRRVCAPDFPIQSRKITVTTTNCGSRIVSDTLDPSDNKCLIIQENVQGCGEDNLLGIKNCKGRGWLNYEVVVQGTTSKSEQVLRQDFEGAFFRNQPYGKIFNIEGSPKNTTWRYTAVISQGDSQVALLDEQTPSSDLFRSTLRGTSAIGHLLIDLIGPTNRPESPSSQKAP